MKTIVTIFYLLCTCCYFSCLASVDQDSIEIRGKFLGNTPIQKVILYAYNSEGVPVQVEEVTNQSFLFKLPTSVIPGVYYLEYLRANDTFKLDVIIDTMEKLIEIEFNYSGNYNYSVFKESVVNQKWRDYLIETQPRIDRLNSLFAYLAKFSGKVDKRIIKVYQKERDHYYKLFTRFINDNSSNWAGFLVQNKPYYFSNLRKAPVKRDFLRMKYYWDGIDTTNPKLINSPLYGEFISNYLADVDSSTYHRPFSDLKKQIELKKSVDIVLKVFSGNELTKMYAKNYMLKQFLLQRNDELMRYVMNIGL
jgi:hypothetical protein